MQTGNFSHTASPKHKLKAHRTCGCKTERYRAARRGQKMDTSWSWSRWRFLSYVIKSIIVTERIDKRVFTDTKNFCFSVDAFEEMKSSHNPGEKHTPDKELGSARSTLQGARQVEEGLLVSPGVERTCAMWTSHSTHWFAEKTPTSNTLDVSVHSLCSNQRAGTTETSLSGGLAEQIVIHPAAGAAPSRDRRPAATG